MAITTGFNSQSISMLFSQNQNNKTNTNSISSIYKLSSDYSTIKFGGYGQLVKSYINKVEGSSSSSKSKTKYEDVDTLARRKESLNIDKDNAKSTSVSKESNKTIVAVEEKADKLIKTAKELNSDNKIYDDSEKLNKKINEFVDNYNSLLKEKENIKSTTIDKSYENLVNATKSNEKLLKAVGITINEDKTLKIDDEVLKNAAKDKLKVLFKDNASYGYSTRLNASMIQMNAKNEANKSNTYNFDGAYTNNYNSGSLFNYLIWQYKLIG